MSTNIILHYSKSAKYSTEAWKRTVESIAGQTCQDFMITLITDTSSLEISELVPKGKFKSVNLKTVCSVSENQSEGLINALSGCDTEFILYIDNRTEEIVLRESTLELFLLAMKNNADAGMVYADYEILHNNQPKEVHLLKHHVGRVRDNQDYGKVLFFANEALSQIGGISSEIQFNVLYDLRLRLAEKFELLHIANRYAGSLYQVVSSAKSYNVFDYLLAGKESQQEAEKILSGHLQRLGAYLQPGAHYSPRPAADAELKASVIIPVNNRPEFICDAIASVQAQTVREVEIIVVVNGGASDPTVAAVKKYQPGGSCYDAAKPEVRLLVHDINNLGLCFNSAAEIARGEYYVQLDSDDQLTPDAIEKILKVYDSDPNIGMVIGAYEVWEKNAAGEISRMEQIPVVTHDEWTEENGRNNLLRINGAGAPRSIPIALIREIGFSMNEEPFARNYGEDYQMVMKISERHRIGRVWDPIYKVVRHAGGTDHSIDQDTVDRNDEAKDFMRKESILRRIALNKNS